MEKKKKKYNLACERVFIFLVLFVCFRERVTGQAWFPYDRYDRWDKKKEKQKLKSKNKKSSAMAAIIEIIWKQGLRKQSVRI